MIMAVSVAVIWWGCGLLIDLCMWVKNGARTLPVVLDRINSVIPVGVVNQRLIVDDGSRDDSVLIAKSRGWSVIANEGHGISDAANTALKHVESEFFCSFEQDLLLSPLWWDRVAPLVLGKVDVAAASGLRFLPINNFCASIEPYTLTRKGQENIENYGKTLDNTVWNTSVLIGLGGFPKLEYAGLDTYLHCLFAVKGYRWLVDYSVKSVHLHEGFLSEFHHNYFYGLSLSELYGKMIAFSSVGSDVGVYYFFRKFFVSPVAGLKMALAMGDSRLLFAYPAIRFAWALGYLKGRGKRVA